ncbi:hypothetical protein DFH28DRAFT_949173 [Melampsora americana]|nr:hypothetical protein DFH28DRAFT_949173 [Melampsora americana]
MPLCHSIYLRRRCTKAFGARALSFSPAISALESMQPTHSGVQDSISRTNSLDIASDKVEDWTSQKYAHLPFLPDFSLFEPLEQIDNLVTRKESILTDSILNHNTNVALCERLVYLIETDLVAAEELRLHISNHHIALPAHQNIIQHCFGLLMHSKDVQGYLEWINIIPDSELQRLVSKERDSIFDQHLKQILSLIPSSLTTIQQFFETLMLKGCLTNRLIRTTVSHLVRSQSPQTVLEFYYEAVRKMCDQSADLSEPDRFLGLCTKLFNHTILQLANQRHLSEAMKLVNEFWNPGPESPVFRKRLSPSTYRVLADQLLSRVADEQGSKRDNWSEHLERIFSSWNLSDPIGLESWLSSSENLSKLPHGSPLTHKVSRSHSPYLDQTVSSLCDGTNRTRNLGDTTHRLVLYLRTVLSHGNHVKFVKSSHIANVIQKMVSLGGSFEEASRKYGYCEPHENEEQYLRSLVFDHAKLQLFLNKVHSAGQSLEFEDQLLLPMSTKFRSDLILLWAHTWMIYYQRNKQYARVIEIFLQYFIPLGVDCEMLKKSQADGSIKLDIQTTSVPLIHPTTGVLTVLYDSILHTQPSKSASSILSSFLQHISPSSTSTSDQPEGSTARGIESLVVSHRLKPNSASFQPFMRAFLRVGDVERALNVLIEMQRSICIRSEDDLNSEEGGPWIDLLEWCASQSGGRINSNDRSNWGIDRKRKRLGWNGEMKERLVYSVLERLIREEEVERNGNLKDRIEPHLVLSSSSNSMINPISLIPKLYLKHSDLIDDWLHELRSSTTLKKKGFCLKLNLKLLHRIRSGFRSCGNRRGRKVMERLIKWRIGKLDNGEDWKIGKLKNLKSE